MFAQRFAQFVLKRRLNAALLAIVFASLPFFGWLSSVIVALYTLRKGTYEGFIVCLWSVLPGVVLVFVMHNWMALGSRVFLGSFLIWVLASMFRKAPSWLLVVLVACLVGICVVLVFHLFISDVPQWWAHYLSTSAVQFEKSLGMDANQQAVAQSVAGKIASYATGLNASVFVFAAILQLIIARILDLSLPDAYAKLKEARKIKMPLWMIFVLVLFIILNFTGPAVAKDLLPLILLPFFVAGLSLINHMLIRRLAPLKVLFIYFILIIVMMMLPIIALVIAFIAAIDSFVDFRRLSDKRRK